jgi:hypothetical protein
MHEKDKTNQETKGNIFIYLYIYIYIYIFFLGGLMTLVN